MGPEKELIHHVSVKSRPRNDHMLISSSPAKNLFSCSQLLKYLRRKAFASTLFPVWRHLGQS